MEIRHDTCSERQSPFYGIFFIKSEGVVQKGSTVVILKQRAPGSSDIYFVKTKTIVLAKSLGFEPRPADPSQETGYDHSTINTSVHETVGLLSHERVQLGVKLVISCSLTIINNSRLISSNI